MMEIIEVKNMQCTGERVYPISGGELKMKTMVLHDLDAERWNSLAERTNIKSFIRMTGRQPVSYEEVMQWVRGLIKGTKKAPAATGAVSVHA